jgi:5,10-methenyltetrahydromethanopterin hydrogenase
MHSVLLNNWLKIAVMKSGELSLTDLKRDKETGAMTESTIAIYSSELKLLTDVVNLLVKRAIFHKQITTVDDLSKLTIELTGYCASEFKKLNRNRR